MKKATFTIGLFTIGMILTSFATPETSNSKIVNNTLIISSDGTGGQSSGGNRKVDFTGSSETNYIVVNDGTGGQSSGGNRKVD